LYFEIPPERKALKPYRVSKNEDICSSAVIKSICIFKVMGVTIHFEGQLISEQDFDMLINKAKDFAQRNCMQHNLISDALKSLARVKNEKEWNYDGPTKGIAIQPDRNCDPLVLEFDTEHYIQEYCKTQFAGIEVHLKIIYFLKEIKSHFSTLIVIDEGEYWESEDELLLQKHFNDYFIAAEKAVTENPKLSGPFRLQDGRLIDLMENN